MTKRIRVHTEKQFWGFYPDGDFLILKKVPAKDFEDPDFFSGDILNPNLFCTFVTIVMHDNKPISYDWSEFLPRITSLGISIEVADKGVEYLKKGGRKLILNIYANCVIAGKKIIRGPDLGTPMSLERSKSITIRQKDGSVRIFGGSETKQTGIVKLTMKEKKDGSYKVQKKRKNLMGRFEILKGGLPPVRVVDAVERAEELSRTPIQYLPDLLQKYTAYFLDQGAAICQQTFRRANAHYAQAVEGLSVEDPAYKITPAGLAWFTQHAQARRIKKLEEANKRILQRVSALGNTDNAKKRFEVIFAGFLLDCNDAESRDEMIDIYSEILLGSWMGSIEHEISIRGQNWKEKFDSKIKDMITKGEKKDEDSDDGDR